MGPVTIVHAHSIQPAQDGIVQLKCHKGNPTWQFGQVYPSLDLMALLW